MGCRDIHGVNFLILNEPFIGVVAPGDSEAVTERVG
jgi:hypothetical protein